MRAAALLAGLALMAGAACTSAPADAPEAPSSEAPEAPDAAKVMDPLAEDTVMGEVSPEPEPIPEAPEAGEVKPDLDPLDRTDDTCGLDSAKPFLGKPAGDIPAADLPDNARIIGPDTQVTMDYVPTRLNVLTDASGKVIGLKCG